MTTGAKIILSGKELELVCNTEWILTKHAIIKKVYQLFGDILPEFENALLTKKGLPAEVFTKSAKISKGENYRQLPYVILDYPRYFGKEETIAVRTLFWWGNFFSISLQVSGNFKIRLVSLLKENFIRLQKKECWICVNDQPWDHHFDADNFRLVQSINENEFADILLRKPFIKIAKKIPLSNWQEIPGFLSETFSDLIDLMEPYQAPRR